MWPMKENLIHKLQEQHEREAMQKEALASGNKLASLASQAANRAESFVSASQKVDSAGKQKIIDNSRKAFYKEFKQVVEAADVILQVLDARDPFGCRVREVEQMILQGGSNKRIVLVLNKIDLVPKEVLEGWLKVLRTEFPTIAFKASTQNQRSNLGQVKNVAATDARKSTSECLGADTLIELLKNYCRNLNIKTSITVGVVGYPNVGKSSLINSLKRSKVCKVGATPGVTTVSQEISLDKNIKLLDCPGIVFSSDAEENSGLFLRNCLKVEQLEDPITPVGKIVEKCSMEQLMKLYQIPHFRDTQEFLLHVARRQGKLNKGGLPNFEAAAKAVLNDWNLGKIPFYTLPPVQHNPSGPATIVTTWAPEFDLSGIERMEVDNVLSAVQHMDATNACSMEMESEPAVDEAPQLVIGDNFERKKKTQNDNGYDAQMTREESLLNPQTNKKRLKDMKKAKKVSMRASSQMDDEAMDITEDYDFSQHFTQ